MSTCYWCGRPISPNDFKLRRKVKTGEKVSRRYPNPSVSATHTTYGMRLVCAACARKIDWSARKQERIQYLELGIALAVLVMVLIIRALS